MQFPRIFGQQRGAARANNMRHAIQRAGHEVLPILMMVAGGGSTLLFFLGSLYDGTPPKQIVIAVAVGIAFAVEWLTLTFGQDMQDALTDHAWGAFALYLVRAVLAYGVSCFFLANAAAEIWAPRDNLLHIPVLNWAWIMAIFVFGSQFLLKLQPERSPNSQKIAAVIQLVTIIADDDLPMQEQMRRAAAALTAMSMPAALPPQAEQKGLPAPKRPNKGYINGYSDELPAVTEEDMLREQRQFPKANGRTNAGGSATS